MESVLLREERDGYSRMSPAILAAGSTGGDSIGFEPHAPFPQTEIRTPKYCELCGKSFLTLAMAPMKDCVECRERTARHDEEMAIPIPHVELITHSPDYKREYARNYRIARKALSMRATA